jgi:serine/threonine protein phosphatase 1
LPNLVTRLQARVGRSATDGRLIYAIGDVHGRADLLDRVVREIGRDFLATGRADRPVLVLIGDYVDRGPASRDVLDRLTALTGGAEFEVRALKGNHEQALMAFLQDPSTGPAWCMHGGAETLIDYGVTPPESQTDAHGWQRARDAFALALPLPHLNLLRSLEVMAAYGDYVFVHAGVRQGVPLAAQTEADLLWIRDEFLSEPGPFEKVIVHGHTPCEAVSMADDRINIDTGAYATGVLTAVRLENAERRFIQVGLTGPVVADLRGAPVPKRASAARRGASPGGRMLSGVTLALSATLLILVFFLMRAAAPDGLELAAGLSPPAQAAR